MVILTILVVLALNVPHIWRKLFSSEDSNLIEYNDLSYDQINDHARVVFSLNKRRIGRALTAESRIEFEISIRHRGDTGPESFPISGIVAETVGVA